MGAAVRTDHRPSGDSDSNQQVVTLYSPRRRQSKRNEACNACCGPSNAVTNKAGLQAYSANVAKLRTRAQGLVRQGKSKDEVAKVMTAEFNWQPTGLQMEWSMPGIMTELK